MDKNFKLSDNFKIVLYAIVPLFLSVFISQKIGEYGFVAGDVGLYEVWMKDFSINNFYGVNAPWVYPYLAFIPMFIAKVFTFATHNYVTSWIYVNVMLYTVAFIMVKKSFKEFKHTPYILFSLGTLMLFGLYLHRIDGIAIALTLMAIALFNKHKTAAIILLSVAMWIKIWPVAFLIALFFIDKDKIKFAVKAAITNAVIILAPFAIGGSLSNIFGFMSSQSSRGLQLESIYAFPWLAGLGHPFFNKQIITWEVAGDGTELGIKIANIALLVALAGSILLAFIKSLKVKTFESFMLSGTLILYSMIAFNKVGSTQFIGWLLIPVFIFAFIDVKKYKFLIVFSMLTVLVTGLGSPLYYIEIINQSPLGIILMGLKVLFLLVSIGIVLKKMFLSYNREEAEIEESR